MAQNTKAQWHGMASQSCLPDKQTVKTVEAVSVSTLMDESESKDLIEPH
jgi:hypothetical protein